MQPLNKFSYNSDRPISSTPLEERRSLSSKSLVRKIFNKMRRNPRAENPLAVYVEDLDEPLPLQDSTTAVPLTRQSLGENTHMFHECTQSSKHNTRSSTKENIKLTGRAIHTLIARASNIADSNPAKVALCLVKSIIDIYKIVKDNEDIVSRHISSTGKHLEEVEEVLREWKTSNKEDNLWMIHFKTTLLEELQKLEELGDESNFRKFVDHEDEQKRIVDIFTNINEARVRFELGLGIRIFKAVYDVDKVVKAMFFDRLKPSDIAHHDYIVEGEEGRLLRRQVCTPGTRIGILDDIVTWAKSTLSDSPNVYWLFGHAGSGKTTIAYTIARRFEFTGDSDDTIILGGNFFCSRQFEETRLSKYIICTIVYHLAFKCKPFSDALNRSGRLDTINQNRRTQLEGLLFGPWQESEVARLADPSTPPHYLIVIDALDEINGTCGSDFLRDLVDVINKSDQKCLSGLKFFVTSRSDQGLVTHVRSLERKRLYRLQDVKEEEARDDVAKYLKASLPHFVHRPEMDLLVEQAAGLFIYAATVVKLLAGCQPLDQKNFLNKLFYASSDPIPSRSTIQDPDSLINQLYYRILADAFGDLREEERACRLQLLYTFLCSREPLSIPSATSLLFAEDPEETDPAFSYITIANDVFDRLHSVLYVEGDKVLSYHKSFPDYIFDKTRSANFWCDKVAHHRFLTGSCFRIMENGLRFNIANISSSFIFDHDNGALAGEVEQNITSVLSYSCRHWDHHLLATIPIPLDPLHNTLSEFLKLHALFWIEAMNLMSLRGHCHPMLLAARKWLINSKNDSPLAQDLAEAASFAAYFSGSSASLSTPHLYISSLATWPRKVNPCWSWKNHFPRIPQFINASMGGTVLMTLNMDSYVYSVAVSSDGSHIASGTDNNLVRVWDALTGEEKHVLKEHTDTVNSVAFSSDGSRIVSGSDDKSIRVWDVLTGKVKHVLEGHTDRVNSVAFSSDGYYIVSGSFDKSVRIWDVLTGKEKHVLKGHTLWVKSVAFSSNGSLVVSGSNDKSVRVWDVSTGEKRYVLNGHTHSVNSVAFSGDGSLIVSGWDNKLIRVWDVSTGEERCVMKGHKDTVNAVAFSSDGKYIVSGSDDKSVRVWDTSTGEEKHVLNGHTNWVRSVAFSSDGSRIISGSFDKSVRVWAVLTDGDEKAIDGHTDIVKPGAFFNDENRIVSGKPEESGRELDALTGKDNSFLKGLTDRVNSVAFSNDGSYIVSGSDDTSVRVWDISSGKEKHVLKGHTSPVSSVMFSGDGIYIVSGSYDNTVRIWDALTGKEKHVLKGHTDTVNSVAISVANTHVASGSDDKSIRVWDALTGVEKRVLEGHTSPVKTVTISGDGSCIFSGSLDKSVRMWNTSTGEMKRAFNGPKDWVRSVALSSDGRYIASGSLDKSVRVWDAITGEEKHVLNGHTKWVKSVAFSSDGNCIVSGSVDRSIRVWDTSTGKQKLVLKGHTDIINSVAFSKYGNCIVSSSDDKSIRLWDISTSEEKHGPKEHRKSVESVFSRGSRYIREEITKSRRGPEHTGWLLSSHGEGYLMFVPPDERLSDDANILTIPQSFISHVDFTNSAWGSEWASCYSL